MTLQELFSDPSRWTQYSLAKRGDGQTCNETDPRAVCFCLIGGMYKCYGSKMADKDGPFKKICEELKQTDLVRWNDSSERKFEDIKELVTRLNI